MSNSFSNDHCIVYRPRSGALKFHYVLGSKQLFINKVSGKLNQNTHYLGKSRLVLKYKCLQKIISIKVL